MLKFTHISKTSGTEITNLGKESGLFWGRHDNFWQQIGCYLNFRAVDPWHLPLSFCEEDNFKYNALLNHDFFTCVRNPYDRMVSEYYCKYGNGIDICDQPDELNFFLQKKIANLENLKDFKFAHFIPQHFYVYDKNFKYTKYVLKFENIESEFNNLMKNQNLNCKFSYRKSDYRKLNKNFLNSETIEKIKKTYEKDFELFDYDIRLTPYKRITIL